MAVVAHETGIDLVNFEQFCHLVPDGQKADLLDGVIFMASPDSFPADRLAGFVRTVMHMTVEMLGAGGVVVGSRFAFRLSERRAPEPDVAYVARGRVSLIENWGMPGPPDIAVEIVSRESRQRDYGEKRNIYEEAGVKEYWIIDPIQARCEFLTLGDDGKFQLARLAENRKFQSRVVEGLWIDVEWLLADPLPSVRDCLAEICGPSR